MSHTLWELAQSWPHEHVKYTQGLKVTEVPNPMSGCRRCQLEQWARETSGDWNKIIELSEQNDSFSEEFKGGLFQGISSCLEDVGVPEGK